MKNDEGEQLRAMEAARLAVRRAQSEIDSFVQRHIDNPTAIIDTKAAEALLTKYSENVRVYVESFGGDPSEIPDPPSRLKLQNHLRLVKPPPE